jgi:hypothetical protein
MTLRLLCFGRGFFPPTDCVAVLVSTVVLLLPQFVQATEVDCLDSKAALEYWRPIREQATTAELPANDLAPELVSCLGSPDPELRDSIGYELFTYWLRQDKLTDETRAALLAELTSEMRRGSEGSTLSRSFSALILSEVMRSDAIKPFMTDAERQTLLDATITALEQEKDFRGLEADIGWVHPIAHMADLLWRFALHPATSKEQASTILDGVRSKVAPTEVSYSFNEGDRLARVVTTLIQNEVIDAGKIGAWIQSFETPHAMDTWSNAFMSSAGMAELHNTKQFLRALADQLEGVDLDARISDPLNALVQGFTQLI